MIRQLALIGLAAGFTICAIYGFQVGQLKGFTVAGQAYLDGTEVRRQS